MYTSRRDLANNAEVNIGGDQTYVRDTYQTQTRSYEKTVQPLCLLLRKRLTYLHTHACTGS